MAVRVRVISYNVHGFRAGAQAVAAAVSPEHPDFVCVQECGSRRAVRSFARALDMGHASSGRLFNRRRNAVLWREPWRLIGVDIRDLSSEARTIPRGFLAARLRHAGSSLTVVSAHLGLADSERAVHARELTDSLAGIAGPHVVGMDLNEQPDGPAARWIAERLFDVFAHSGDGDDKTFSAEAPTVRIDYVFVSGGIRPLAARVLDGRAAEAASDHLPVVADVLLGDDGVA